MGEVRRLNETTVGIIGMGRTGQAVARFLRRRGVQCIGFDEHVKQASPDLIELRRGRLEAADFSDCDALIVSPGIDWRHPALERARRMGKEVRGDLDLFCEHFHGQLLAVTGTNGKTTTVTLIATLLEVLPGGIEAAGNIGRPMLDVLDAGTPPARVVLELSSFQLERSSNIHPRWAALLNVQPDHADMHADMSSYSAAKCRLFMHQGKGDRSLLPQQEEWDALQAELEARGVDVGRFGHDHGQSGHLCAGLQYDENGCSVFWTQKGERQCVPADRLRIRGMHQHMNLAVAAQAAADYGVSTSVISLALETFRGLPHRMQWIGHFGGRDWYDDSKATNPDAASAALQSFDRVLWICGGLRKGLALDALIGPASRHVAHAYVIGRDMEAYADMLKHAGVPFTKAGRLEQAVQLAAAHAEPLPVLLSPAAASQDQFEDYAERGKAFAAAARKVEAA
ncbi:MAG: UDP-N-acetylmuramoyl-L-alanine--D-glutamate ligase [Zetaproteobacteria bacterium]|nr:MAG: UDP-N-acetylmuramoyl-L-alanine--D-glutamate ligase [Zetaproteobacteria bacterium]